MHGVCPSLIPCEVRFDDLEPVSNVDVRLHCLTDFVRPALAANGAAHPVSRLQ